jgi:hypothetical protein
MRTGASSRAGRCGRASRPSASVAHRTPTSTTTSWSPRRRWPTWTATAGGRSWSRASSSHSPTRISSAWARGSTCWPSGRTAAGAAARRARAAATVPLLPVGFTVSGTLAQAGDGLRYASGGTDLLSTSSLLFPGQPIRIINGVRSMDPRNLNHAPGFPAPLMGLPFLTAPAVADIGGDGKPDVILGPDTSNVVAVQHDGTPTPGWPKFTGGWTRHARSRRRRRRRNRRGRGDDARGLPVRLGDAGAARRRAGRHLAPGPGAHGSVGP